MKNKFNWSIILVLQVALVLRFFLIGKSSYWLDESIKAKIIEYNTDETDIVLFYGCGVQIPFERYYCTPDVYHKDCYDSKPQLVGVPETYEWGNPVKCDMHPVNLTSTLEGYQRVWLVVSHVEPIDSELSGYQYKSYNVGYPYIQIYEVFE